MRERSTYEVWASHEVWRRWVKAPLFAEIDDQGVESVDAPASGDYRALPRDSSEVDVSWAPAASDAGARAFIVVDLEGAASIEMGLALGVRGYSPVLAINACTDPDEVIDMAPVLEALREGAKRRRSFPRERSAPPAFLLDVRRFRGARPREPGLFDNRWMVFRQDLPSAALLLQQGLSRAILVVGEDRIEEDLQHVLFAWQKGGIQISLQVVAAVGPPEPVTIEAPSWAQRLFTGPSGSGELRRNRRGSFGSRVPELPPEPSHG